MPSISSPASNNDVLVTSVLDGDTIEAQIGGITYTVRYIGIDTPESNDWLGEDAKKLNESLLYGKTIRLEKDVSDKDSFGRLLRYVYAQDVSVSAELLKTGMARVVSYPPDTKYEAMLKQSETEAAAAAQGLWSVPQIVSVFFDGEVPKVESDEYVEVSNFSGETFDLTGWKIKDRGGKFFVFPKYVLEAGKTVRIYTNENHPEWGNFSFKSPVAIWNNSGDTAVLYDNEGKSVSRVRYQGVK